MAAALMKCFTLHDTAVLLIQFALWRCQAGVFTGRERVRRPTGEQDGFILISDAAENSHKLLPTSGSGLLSLPSRAQTCFVLPTQSKQQKQKKVNMEIQGCGSVLHNRTHTQHRETIPPLKSAILFPPTSETLIAPNGIFELCVVILDGIISYVVINIFPLR